jgi:alanyl-tRNA synthetase
MFEMLGNWSFGDYFKEESIEWAWEYLTEVLKLDKSRLYATVFEGDKSENLERDNEAAEHWGKYLPTDRIINGNKDDNFWEMGDTGPCGPCSEIHIDLRPDEERKKESAITLVNQDHPQVVEIWNLVFMQYNRKADGSLEALPAKVIDTGMGYERLCMAVQGKLSNYDTDVFQPIIKKIGEISGFTYGEDEKRDIAMRVIADHVRTIAFSITDGQLPSNAKAGYVIRRILRRAVRYGYTFLNRHEGFMYKLLPVLIEVMGDSYPELIAQKTLIEKVIKEEEESFLRTLETGIRLLDRQMEQHKKDNNLTLEGATAFQLYDTFGFPLDLTELILRENGMKVDHDGFTVEMKKQKDRARNAAAVETGDWTRVHDGDPIFIGYDFTETEAEIIRYRKVKQKNKEYYQLVFSQTPFYSEQGGQVGDAGWMKSTESDEKIEIFDTKRENNLAVHLVNKLPSDISTTFSLTINKQRRTAIEANHTATHLMHEALREVLGTHVEQKGSYVSAEVLRFDFSHFEKMTKEQIREVEKLVNNKIREDILIEEDRSVPIQTAKDMGAMALFGEKYDDVVRTIRFGSSIELCGGTHISSTGRIGLFRIVSEGAIAAGVRRIEAITAKTCDEYIYKKEDMLVHLRELLNNTPDIEGALQRLIAENEDMKKSLQEFEMEKASSLKQSLIASKETREGVRIFSTVLSGVSPDIVKNIAFQLKGEFKENLLFVIGTVVDNKPNLTVMLSDDLVKKGMHAGNIIRNAAKHIQGGGGGQPNFAMAGGKNAEGLQKAVDEVLNTLN